ncbi:divalent cation resistant determinant protein C [Caballeronia arationis]|jgi:hypothetical protein|uniref:Outer membrane efflux protein n=1 Tax=Caballeronia arationis TaxID=1777142 RepID=A0A7Z7N6N1_9BURK|nr:divalent cation resistant determinant protein C [Caballeronia arationis]SOE89067.1 Outer membrane efflux protein [Caballeronia arationis]
MRRPLLLVCVMLTGCATYHPQLIAPTQLAQHFEDRSLASADLHAYLARQSGHDIDPWLLPRWNREMLTLAAYYSPALDIARAQWGTAKAGIDVAGAIPNPVLQLPFQYATPNPGPGAPCIAGPALDIPIETAHKRGYRIDQASHLSKAARLALGNEAWKVRTQVRDGLISLYAARQFAAFLSRKAEAQRQVVAMVTKRRLVGENSGPDVDAGTPVGNGTTVLQNGGSLNSVNVMQTIAGSTKNQANLTQEASVGSKMDVTQNGWANWLTASQPGVEESLLATQIPGGRSNSPMYGHLEIPQVTIAG